MIIDFEGQTCITCFIKFMVPKGFTERRREDRKIFFCPNGHSMSYHESELDNIRRERDRLKQQMAEKNDEILSLRNSAESAERRRVAATGQVTKLKKRAMQGECPCCSHKFVDLWAHMRKEHRGFLAEPIEDGEPKRLEHHK